LSQMKCGENGRCQQVRLADWAIHWAIHWAVHWAVRVPQATTEFGLK
jgi:hypothetical protein